MAPSSLRPTSPHPNCSGAICPAGLTAQSHGCRRHPSTNLLKSIYAKAHAADPVYSLRRNPLRHLTFETPFSRFYKVPIPWTQRHPRDPTPTPTPQGTQGDPKGQGKGAKGPREPKGDQRGSSRSREISENCFCPNHNEMASKTLNFNRF